MAEKFQFILLFFFFFFFFKLWFSFTYEAKKQKREAKICE